MRELISITELARLRKVSTETLRHYDRIGLFKPSYVNPETGYRYYSILYQNEKLGTIKELRQLGMTLDEIKEYFEHRDFEQSIKILKSKQIELRSNIEKMNSLDLILSQKIEFVENIRGEIELGKPFVKNIGKRLVITNWIGCDEDVSLSFEAIKLEGLLDEIAPIVASNRMGIIWTLSDFLNDKERKKAIPYINIIREGNTPTQYLSTFKSGQYACIYYSGNLWENAGIIEILINYANQNNFKLDENIIQIIQIDMSVTDKSEEMIYEIQARIK